jgi:hypothetical protein
MNDLTVSSKTNQTALAVLPNPTGLKPINLVRSKINLKRDWWSLMTAKYCKTNLSKNDKPAFYVDQSFIGG